jgi:hypothetical protein
VDIQYILGRDHYRLLIRAQGNQIVANTYLDKEILEEGAIDSTRYPAFLEKADSFVSQYQGPSLPPQELCRNPFLVTVRIGSDTKTARGCRSKDGGALSKLVRDGEFLLYSKN